MTTAGGEVTGWAAGIATATAAGAGTGGSSLGATIQEGGDRRAIMVVSRFDMGV